MRVALAGLALGLSLFAQEVRLTQVASGIPAPTDIQHAGDGSERLFLVQQNGLIRILQDGVVLQEPFLDIRAKTRAQGERGLLGLAFPPGPGAKRHFYVNYTDAQTGDTVIARYAVSAHRDLADAASEQVLLHIDQPFANHNGGQLRFGPDGYLYIGMGDGGAGGDPQVNAQNRGSLLGKMLRIDVESDPGRIVIPPGNPFVNTSGARPEIWALGLRNPWRFSFDRATDDLWIADVGQNRFEEVNFQPSASRGGENYGWNRMEGAHCFLANCDPQGLVLPVAEYSRGEGCSVSGGFVYRGRMFPALRGIYFYGDFCSGRIWGIERQGAAWMNRLLLSSGFSITTFGEDEAGEMYVANAANGTIHRIEGGRAPRLSAAAVGNAASFAPGLAPGSLATLFAPGVLDEPGVASAPAIPLPASLAGVSVTINGVAAPIHAVANSAGQEQVNFQVPFDVRGATASVAVTRDGRSSAAVDVPVREVQPAVYTADGVYAIAVRVPGYTLVTAARPLAPGEFVFVYAAGLGPVTNQPATGAAAPLDPLAEAIADVRVTLAGIPCDVQYAGLAPGLAGVYQVNFRAAGNLPSGMQDLVLTAGGQAGPPVKVAVQ
jgi:uncharacterized protein (TIGR03437 family)